jgi:hypothetical protein
VGLVERILVSVAGRCVLDWICVRCQLVGLSKMNVPMLFSYPDLSRPDHTDGAYTTCRESSVPACLSETGSHQQVLTFSVRHLNAIRSTANGGCSGINLYLRCSICNIRPLKVKTIQVRIV